MTRVRSNYPRIKKEKKKKRLNPTHHVAVVRHNWVMKDMCLGKMKGKRDSRRKEKVNKEMSHSR